MSRKPYPTNLTDQEWERLQPLIPPAKTGGRPRTVDMQEIVNAILYVQRSGCSWRLLPHDLPPWPTVYNYFRAWRRSGIWEEINQCLRSKVYRTTRRKKSPPASTSDNQSVKTTKQGGKRVSKRGKKAKGCKRHILVDTRGLIVMLGVYDYALKKSRKNSQVMLSPRTES